MPQETLPSDPSTLQELKARFATLEEARDQKDSLLNEKARQLEQFNRVQKLSERERALVRQKIADGLDETMALEAVRNQIRQDEYDANPSNSTALRLYNERLGR